MTRLICLLVLINIPFTHATNLDDKAEQNEEVIEVVGNIPTVQLAKMVVEARMDFYDLYNQLNDIDEFRVVCDKHQKTGTKFRETRCFPMYYKNAAADMTNLQVVQTFRTRRIIGGRPPGPQNYVRAAANKKKEADAYMKKLIEENPKLLEKYNALLAANQAYERRKISD